MTPDIRANRTPSDYQTLRAHLQKISFPNLLQRCLTWQMVRYFVPRVSTFFATKSSLWEKRVSTYFCRRFLKTFCNNLSRDSGDEEILHNPKLYKTIFCFALMKVTPKKFEPVAGHLFAMSKFKKYERTWHWSHVSESGPLEHTYIQLLLSIEVALCWNEYPPCLL